MEVDDAAMDFRSSPVDRGPEMRAKASTESKFECGDENGGDRAEKTPKIERKRVKRTPNRSDNDKVKKWPASNGEEIILSYGVL